MQGQGFLAKPSHSPTSFAMAFTITGAGLAALLLAQPYVRQVIEDNVFKPVAIPLPPVPPPPEPQPHTKQPRTQQPSSSPKTQRQPVDTAPFPPLGPTTGLTGGGGEAFDPGPVAPPIIPEVTPIKPPVLVDSRVDPRFVRELQPPYPPAMEREEIEGAVSVRVKISTDGRVLAVEAVRADQEAFLKATRDWALRHWRFLPATRDGVAVESWRTMTVRFTINR